MPDLILGLLLFGGAFQCLGSCLVAEYYVDGPRWTFRHYILYTIIFGPVLPILYITDDIDWEEVGKRFRVFHYWIGGTTPPEKTEEEDQS